MNPRKTIPFVLTILLLAGLASANRIGTPATPQGDAPKPKPSASASAPASAEGGYNFCPTLSTTPTAVRVNIIQTVP